MNGLLFALMAGLVLAAAVMCLLWPLRGRSAPTDRRTHDLAVYQDQLAEVDRDQQRGLLVPDQAEAARVEIRRRILRAMATEDAAIAAPARPVPRMTLIALAVGMPLLSGATYVTLGRPDLPSLPFGTRPAQPLEANVGQMQATAAALEAELAEKPDDIGGWIRLGRAKAALGQMDGALQATRRALAIAPQDALAQVELADLLTTAAGGVVTPEARTLFERSIAGAGGEERADPRAVYFLGVADAQAGNPASAVERWRRLLARAPEDAPWRQDLTDSIQMAATQAGIDPGPLPTTAPAPDAADMAAMAALSPEERDQRIRGMVEGLDARLRDDPDDVEGWLRLARARQVLGERAAATAALERAAALRPDDPEVLLALGESLIEETHAPTGLPLLNERAREVFARMDRAAPLDPRPAWFLGLAAAQAGDQAGAVRHWQAMLSRLPADHPDRKPIEELVRQLGS